MKSFYLLFSLIINFLLVSAQQDALRSPAGSNIKFFVRNVCQDFNQVIICNGSDSVNTQPSMGTINCTFSSYMHNDTLDFNEIKFFGISNNMMLQWGQRLFFVGDENKIITYWIEYPSGWCDSAVITAGDTMLTDSITDIEIEQDKISYIRGSSVNNNFFHNGFNLHLNMRPTLIKAAPFNNLVAVLGKNLLNETELMIVDLDSQVVIKDTILPTQLNNPVSLYYYNKLYVVSCPGDSTINLWGYDFAADTARLETIYTGSGVNVSEWTNYGFDYQPESDTSLNLFDKQIRRYNFQTGTQ